MLFIHTILTPYKPAFSSLFSMSFSIQFFSNPKPKPQTSAQQMNHQPSSKLLKGVYIGHSTGHYRGILEQGFLSGMLGALTIAHMWLQGGEGQHGSAAGNRPRGFTDIAEYCDGEEVRSCEESESCPLFPFAERFCNMVLGCFHPFSMPGGCSMFCCKASFRLQSLELKVRKRTHLLRSKSQAEKWC